MSKLNGKTVIYLGSSVTYGHASGGIAFPELLEKSEGLKAVKEAVSGTTLIDAPRNGKASYIERMKTIDKSITADAFICQLSTNDATIKAALGTISEGFDIENFDPLTVCGAIEYVIAYAKKTWNCPVFFYTGTFYDSEDYQKMVDCMLQIAQKWNIKVLDLWNDSEMRAVTKEDYESYMKDPIHPNIKGYTEWWTPKFKAFFEENL